MREQSKTEQLNDAFNTFRNASEKLEQQYALLERRTEELNDEIAEKNRAMERTRRLAAMGEMAAKIAHEIRNPLGSMSIFATLLERELSRDPGKKRLAGHIIKGVKNLDNIVSNMLLFTSSPSANLKPVDVSEAIEDAVVLARGRGRDAIEIETTYEGSTLVLGDLVQLRQMFLNLFLNALDSISGSGKLSISTRASLAGSVEIEVVDTGPGIPEASLDRIFDPFFSTKERGTGLGLAIVAGVVSAHGGDVNVCSTEGEGASFLITLQAAEGASSVLEVVNR